jgi:hypothetical protein
MPGWLHAMLHSFFPFCLALMVLYMAIPAGMLSATGYASVEQDLMAAVPSPTLDSDI